MTKINTLLRDSSMTVALIVTVALLLWITGFPMLMNTAHAAALTSISDTISDSDLSVVANHTIAFTTPTGVAAGGIITVTFAAGFNMNTVAFEDMDLTDDGTDVTLAAAASGASWGAALASQVITLTNGSGAVGAGSLMVLDIGLNATHSGTGDTQIINPNAAASVNITIAGGFGDTGTAVVAIIDDVTVSASVGTSLTFTVAGIASGTGSVVNGEADSGGTTDIATTATAIPWGTLTAGTTKLAAQTLSVATNASNGYAVTMVMDQRLTSSAGDTINFFDDGTPATDPADWSAPATTLGSVDTYGHMGFTSDDANIAAADLFNAGEWAGDALAGDHIVLHHSGPSDGSTQSSGLSHVGFRVQTSALQEAGSDYTAQLTYIATPIF